MKAGLSTEAPAVGQTLLPGHTGRPVQPSCSPPPWASAQGTHSRPSTRAFAPVSCARVPRALHPLQAAGRLLSKGQPSGVDSDPLPAALPATMAHPLPG